MEILQSSDFTATWIAKLQAACNAKHQGMSDMHPAIAFDGRVSLPAWLVESARDQAERVFLIFDGTPVAHRDLGWAEEVIEVSQIAYLTAWGDTMDALHSREESWARDAAETAGDAFHDRLKELVVRIHKGGST